MGASFNTSGAKSCAVDSGVTTTWPSGLRTRTYSTSSFSVADEYPKTSWPNSSTPAWLWIRITASVSLTSVPSFSKRTRFKIRSKTAASWELALFVFGAGGGEVGACAKTSEPIKKAANEASKKPTTSRKRRQDILQFFYAVLGVKSNEGHGFTPVSAYPQVRKSLAVPVLS